jgi:hypothetical protein
MATLEEEYWDADEYGFFESLTDDDKLLYLYDVLLGGFTNEHYISTSEKSELNFELEDDRFIHPQVTVTFDDNMRLAISGAKVEVLETAAHNMMINGLMLVDRETIDAGGGVVILIYKIIGNAPPICYN